MGKSRKSPSSSEKMKSKSTKTKRVSIKTLRNQDPVMHNIVIEKMKSKSSKSESANRPSVSPSVRPSAGPSGTDPDNGNGGDDDDDADVDIDIHCMLYLNPESLQQNHDSINITGTNAIPPGTYTEVNGDTVVLKDLDNDSIQGDGIHIYVGHGAGNSNNHVIIEMVETTGMACTHTSLKVPITPTIRSQFA